MGELLTAGIAATSLVHRFFRTSDRLWTDVTRILVCRSVQKHGRASQFLRRSEVERLFKVFRELRTARKRMDGSLSRFCDFDITTWVVAARLGVVEGSLSRRRDFDIMAWVVVAWQMMARDMCYQGPGRWWWKAAYLGGVTLESRPGLRLLCLPLQRLGAM